MAIFGNESNKINSSENQVNPQPPATLNPAHDPTHAPSGTLASSPAYLDRGTKVTGQLCFDGPAKIDGRVEGEIKGKEVTIGENAEVAAKIIGESVVVCGTVEGDITADKRIEIRPTGRVTGNIAAPTLVIHHGAHFEGHCAMTKESDEHKRKAHHNGAHAPDRTTA